MVFRDLFVLLLVGACGFSRGMDVEAFPFFRAPQDVQNLILEFTWDNSKKCYPMYRDADDTEFLVIPYTLRFIDFVEREEKDILLDHQLWASRDNHGEVRCEVRLYRDKVDADDRYEPDISGLNLPTWMTTKEPTGEDFQQMCSEFMNRGAEQPESDQEDDPMELPDSDENKSSSETKQGFGLSKTRDPKIWFDGINNVNTALVGMCDRKATEPKSIFFLLKQSEPGLMRNHGKRSPFLQLDGVVQSVLLHPECNRVMCVVTHGDTSSLHIGDVASDLHAINNSYRPLDLQHFKKPFIKAIYLGKNTYLALTGAGNLATVWLDEANKIQHLFHKQPSGIRDIAVDNSCQTATGFKPRIAYVNNSGEVFVTDLTRFGNSITMMYHSTVESPSTIFRFFYDKGQLAVLHCNEKGFGNFIVWPDNLGPLYLKTVVAQKMQQQKNS